MAWYCSGSTNSDLVENLFQEGLIKDARVKDAMMRVRSIHPCLRPST
jgi:protein-L-isoaspartate(D-aspartate) O-methyltransferase